MSSLVQIYEKVFDLPYRGKQDFVRVVVWAVVSCAAVAVVSVVDKTLAGEPDGMMLVEVLMLVAITVFVWWTMHCSAAASPGAGCGRPSRPASAPLG